METIGIIGAMEEEIIFLKNKIELVTAKEVIGLTFYVGRMYGNSVVLVRSGIGKVNAAICAQVLIDLFAVDKIINVGVAGALNEHLTIGQIVVSMDAVQHDMDTSALGDPVAVMPRMDESYFKADPGLVAVAQKAADILEFTPFPMLGRIASGDQFIASEEGKERIKRIVKGDCAEMEGAAIAHTCYLNKIPFVIIRSISDQADGKAHMSYQEFTQIAAEQGGRLVEKMLELMTV